LQKYTDDVTVMSKPVLIERSFESNVELHVLNNV